MQNNQGHIPRSFIDDLLARVDIVEIIEPRIKLRKTGSNYSACCPFHNEKTPSFTVSPSKQFYYCFGCKAHGNVITFLMEYDRLSFVDAIETLAAQVGVEIPREVSYQQLPEIKDLYTLLDKVKTFYQQQLKQTQSAIDYLKSRGISGAICRDFAIGYVPNGWDNVHKKFPTQQPQLLKTGVLLRNENKVYDRFRQRIMFPIRDARGRVIGFGGRTLGDDKPKYLNSPETPIFNKGSEVYGLYEAKQANRKLERLLVVEGYMDVIALAQHQVTYAVATLGTAVTSKQVQLLFRHANKLVFCFDGDLAGRTAAWRALENTLPIMRDGLQADFLFLPEGEDPDSQIRQEETEKFLQRINNAMPLSEFFFKHLAEGIKTNTIDGKATIAQRARTIIDQMPNGIFKQLMLEKLSKIVGMKISKANTQKNLANKTTKNEQHNLSPTLKRAIELLLYAPELAQTVDNLEAIAKTNIPGTNLLTLMLATLKQQPDLSTGALLERWRNSAEGNLLAELAAHEPLLPKTHLKDEFCGIMQQLLAQAEEALIRQLLAKANTEQLSQEERLLLQQLISKQK